MTYNGNTDRRYQDWHYSLPQDWHFMDLDGLDYCARCKEPLMLTETTRNGQKATSVLKALARRADLPAVLILLPEVEYDGIGANRVPVPLTDETPISWRWRKPDHWWREGTLGDWKVLLGKVIERHVCEVVVIHNAHEIAL